MPNKSKGNKKQKAQEQDDMAALDEALEEAGDVRKQASELVKAGEGSMSMNDWKQALEFFTAALALDPNNALIFARRSQAFLAKGMHSQAMADAANAVAGTHASSEEGADCLFQLGNCLLRSGQTKDALKEYNKGLKLHPKHPGCLQGSDEAAMALQKESSGEVLPPVVTTDDVEAQTLKTLPAPEEVLGKGFEIVHLMVGSYEKPLSFLLSTTMPQEAIITPHAAAMLGYSIAEGRTVDLKGVRFEDKTEGDVKLMGAFIGDLQNVEVTGFLQARIAQKALKSTLHGMLGLKFLEQYDLDLDRVRQHQRFKTAGAAAKASSMGGSNGVRIGAMHLRGLKLPGGLSGLVVEVQHRTKGAVPLLGIIDTSSMFSMINWNAAKQLEIADGPECASLANATKVAGPSKEGAVEMPLVPLKVHLASAGDLEIGCRMVGGYTKEELEEGGKGKGWKLDLEEKEFKPSVPFGRVNVAIGDAIQFEMLVEPAFGQFNAGAIVIGQDILAQAPRLTMSFKDKQVWLDPPGRIVDAPPL